MIPVAGKGISRFLVIYLKSEVFLFQNVVHAILMDFCLHIVK